MATKKSTRIKPVTKPGAAVTLKLSLNDLKKITDNCSSFGGDTWQQIHWGKLELGLEPTIQLRAGAKAKKAARKKTNK